MIFILHHVVTSQPWKVELPTYQNIATKCIGEVKTNNTNKTEKTSLRFHWLLHGTAWWWLGLCQKQSEYIRIWNSDMAASNVNNNLTSSGRNFGMQPIFSMMTNVYKCEQMRASHTAESPRDCSTCLSIAFVTWHPSTASTASSQTIKHNQSVSILWKKRQILALKTNGIISSHIKCSNHSIR